MYRNTRAEGSRPLVGFFLLISLEGELYLVFAVPADARGFKTGLTSAFGATLNFTSVTSNGEFVL